MNWHSPGFDLNPNWQHHNNESPEAIPKKECQSLLVDEPV
jgi:hypothetical protein